ncbi:ERAD-associated protein [Phlyctochytrium planicorne]|nr:ERAD-associated protein [Phlyctochytrium planicorne]
MLLAGFTAGEPKQPDGSVIFDAEAQNHDLATSGPLTEVEDLNEIPPPPHPLPLPGQDLVDYALELLSEVQNSSVAHLVGSASTSSDSSEGDALGRILFAVTERIIGPIVPPTFLSSFLGGDAGFLGPLAKWDQQVDETWRFDHVALEEAETLMKSEKGESNVLKLARASRLLALAGYELGHTDALMHLAEMNLFRKFSQARNTTSAFKHYHRLAHHHGNATAQRYVGLMYSSGIGVKRNYAKALVYLNFAAMAQDTFAEQALGYWYANGIGVAKSCEDSVYFYRSVADKAINKFKEGPPFGLAMPPGKQRLADEMGGVFGPGASGPGQQQSSHNPISPQTMREIYEVQAEEGDYTVQVHLGRAYYEGAFPIGRDYKMALKYFKMAARSSFTGSRPPAGTELTQSMKTRMTYAGVASGYLGLMHWRGDGVKQDNATARKFFERGEEFEDGKSLAALGIMHLKGIAGFKKDSKKALSYFLAAAQLENAEAQVQLGEMHLVSNKPDGFSQAYKLYAAAAGRTPSHIMALYRLGEMFSKGIGTQANCLMGVGYLKMVAEKGDWHDDSIRKAEALSRIGNYESALVHYLLAAERGLEVAQSNAAWMIDQGKVSKASMDRIFANGGKDGVDPYEVAIVLWNRAANQGNVDGRVKVGDYYFYGLGTRVAARRGSVGVKSGGEAGKTEADGVKVEPEGVHVQQITDGTHAEQPVSEKPAKVEPEKQEFGSMIQGIVGNITRWISPLLPGALPNSPDYSMAAMYYHVAAEELSALAQWNMGYMHENGLGVAKVIFLFPCLSLIEDVALTLNQQDYPLAKRMYDMALATNGDAYLPVNLALFQLFIKSSVSFVTQFVKDLVTGRLFFQIWQRVESLALGLLRTELGPLFDEGAGVGDLLIPILEEDDVGGAVPPAAAAPNAGGNAQPNTDFLANLFGPGPHSPLVRGLLRAWSGVWFELVLVSGLAALASVLFLWRQFITAAEENARRVQMENAAFEQRRREREAAALAERVRREGGDGAGDGVGGSGSGQGVGEVRSSSPVRSGDVKVGEASASTAAATTIGSTSVATEATGTSAEGDATLRHRHGGVREGDDE